MITQLNHSKCPYKGKIEFGTTCPILYHTLYPYFLTLLYGGKFTYNEAGDCDVCCPALSFGNVNELSFREIWEGEQRKRVMEYINSTPPEGNECSVCNQWKGNRVLEGYRNRTKWSDFLI